MGVVDPLVCRFEPPLDDIGLIAAGGIKSGLAKHALNGFAAVYALGI
jgi:hypothetical protein